MKIESFRTLNAVLRGGSFAAGAADMNLSPSAVSLQMKQMQKGFSDCSQEGLTACIQEYA